MVSRRLLECIGCQEKFILRLSIGYQYNTRFRIECPECHSEIDGELFVDYMRTDGTIKDSKEWHTTLRIKGASEGSAENFTATSETKWVNLFNDMPIDRGLSIQEGVEPPLFGPARFMMYKLADRMYEYEKRRNAIYGMPENDVKLIKSIYLCYKRKDLDRAIVLLDKVSHSIPKSLREVPSICGMLYNTVMIPLVGGFAQSQSYLDIIDHVIKAKKQGIFQLHSALAQMGQIDSILDTQVDLMEELFDNRLILLIGLFLELVDLSSRDDLLISINYPSESLRLYEQLCEANHHFMKVIVGYLNILNRGDVSQFSLGRFSEYKVFCKNATIFQTLDLLAEHKELHAHFGQNIDRGIRNAIAHRNITFSTDGQKIIANLKGKKSESSYWSFLLKLQGLSRSIIFFFGVLTDLNRVVTDINEGRLKLPPA